MSRAIIIQARNGSSRFPSKMIREINNKGTLCFEFLLNRLLSMFSNEHIILATTNLKRDDSLVTIANKFKIKSYRGSEDDVLDRFVSCAKEYSIKEVVRLCADNPFIFLEDLKNLYNYKLDIEDYVSFNIKGVPSILTHFGFWAELVSVRALKKVQSLTSEKQYIEHVTNFIYTNKDLFSVKLLKTKIPENYIKNNIRLTLDTEKDLDNIKYIIDDLDGKGLPYSLENIFNVIQSNPFLIDRMTTEINKNSK